MNLKEELLKIRKIVQKLIKDESTTLIINYNNLNSNSNIEDSLKEESYTMEEYIKRIKKIRKEEIESNRFKNIQKFIFEYRNRDNLYLENKLFEIINTYEFEQNIIGKNYEYKQISRIKKFKELENFFGSLTQEQMESNIYLALLPQFLKSSEEDCSLIIEELRNKISNLESIYNNTKIDLNMDIPKKRLTIIPTPINEQIGIPYYSPYSNKMSYVNILDNENLSVYKEYNEYVVRINRMAEDIYHLQMWNLLSSYSEQINNNYFGITNNMFEYKFKTSYYIENCNINTEEIVNEQKLLFKKNR